MILTGERTHSIRGKFTIRFTLRGDLSDARDSERKIRRMKTGRHLTEEMWVSGGVRTFT